MLNSRPQLQSLALSDDKLHVVAVVAVRVEFNSIFERLPKTFRLAANRWSAMHRNQSGCNGGRPLSEQKFSEVVEDKNH